MAWTDFTGRSWTVTKGGALSERTVLNFEGDGRGGAESRLKTGDGGVWGTEARYSGGSGTEESPDVVVVKRNGGYCAIGRSGSTLVCYPGRVLPKTLKWNRIQGMARPRGQSGDGGEETQPIWVAQEGGGRR